MVFWWVALDFFWGIKFYVTRCFSLNHGFEDLVPSKLEVCSQPIQTKNFLKCPQLFSDLRGALLGVQQVDEDERHTGDLGHPEAVDGVVPEHLLPDGRRDLKLAVKQWFS